jgi:signal transduction histidine kinase
MSEMVGKRLDRLGSSFAEQLGRMEVDESKILPLQGRRRVKCQMLSFMDRGFPRSFLLMDELTDELHRSEKAAYEKVIRVMSHEVNNTTSAVGSLLDSCLTYEAQIGEKDRSDFSHALKVAISRSDRMNRFMQAFAEVVRLPDPQKQACDVKQLIEEVVLLMKEKSRDKNIRWLWEVEAELPSVKLDAAQMEQVFINIFQNALEAIGKEGTITIQLGLNKRRPFAVIRDSGPGIPAEVREHLFTPFYTSKTEGRGIGLTVIREVLVRHGFDFSLESRGAGCTEFSIFF